MFWKIVNKKNKLLKKLIRSIDLRLSLIDLIVIFFLLIPSVSCVISDKSSKTYTNLLCKEWRLVERIGPNANKPYGNYWMIDTTNYSLDSIYQEKIIFYTDYTYLKQTKFIDKLNENNSILDEKGRWEIRDNPRRVIFYCANAPTQEAKSYGCMGFIINLLNDNNLRLYNPAAPGGVIKGYISIND